MASPRTNRARRERREQREAQERAAKVNDTYSLATRMNKGILPLDPRRPSARPSFASQWKSCTPEALLGNEMSGWRDSASLRAGGVQFVSGGKLKRDQLDSDVKEGQEGTGDKRPSSSSRQSNNAGKVGSGVVQQEFWTEPKSDGLDVGSTKLDDKTTLSQHNVSLLTPKSSPVPAMPVSPSSSTSADIIIFTGRRELERKRTQPVKRWKDDPDPRIYDHPPATQKTSSSSHVPPASKLQSTLQSVPAFSDANNLAYGLDTPERARVPEIRQKRSRRSRKRLTAGEGEENDNEEDLILRDYAENVKAQQQMESLSISTDNKPSGLDGHCEISSQSRREAWGDKYEQNLPAFQGRGTSKTSNDKWSNIVGIIARRDGASGTQYHVIPSDSSKDAEWVPKSILTSKSAMDHILTFEEHQDDQDDWPSTGESAAISDIVRRDKKAEEDDNARLAKQTSQMSDAELARILNKQAELGIDGENITLFDGAFLGNEDSLPFNSKSLTSNLPTPSNPKHSKPNRHTKNGKGRSFPDAGALADALDEDPYGGFDVMDFDRPSLKPKKKGRKSAQSLPAELEDPQETNDFADQLAQAWENDRAKKSIKKAERERLRKEGLLGAKHSKSAKSGNFDNNHYNSGELSDNVFGKEQLREYLIDDSREEYVLPPMSSPERAQVHQLAKVLNLRSASHGKNEARHSTLTKSERSMGYYNASNIWEIDNLLACRKYAGIWSDRRPYLGRSKPSGSYKGKKTTGSGGGSAAAAASFKDGDVVGAYAPEIGSENKGRAILEKMGWSSGMGIGKEGNKGSVDVITHVVKNSKAGLG